MKLPGVAQEIADVIGCELALKLIASLPRAYHGSDGAKSWRVIMYVPKTLKPDHALVRILGWGPAKQLVGVFGGEILKPPVCSDAMRDARREKVAQMASAGTKNRQIADALGVTERTVRNYLAEIPPEAIRKSANDNRAPNQRAITA